MSDYHDDLTEYINARSSLPPLTPEQVESVIKQCDSYRVRAGHKWKDLCECGELKDSRSAGCVSCRKAAFKALCHPERPHFAKGKCERCYSSEYQRSRDGLNSLTQGRKYQLKHMFSLSIEYYERILQLQDGLCAICGTDRPGGKSEWHVDHDHSCCPGKRSCGKCVRGLLCLQCNHLLGNAKDDVSILMAAAHYLKGGNWRDTLAVASSA